MTRLFITATGTGVGKTWFGCALAKEATARGQKVAAIKPIETGCRPDPLDAIALASACDRPDLANAPGLYRAPEPLAPYAVARRGGPAITSLSALTARVRKLEAEADLAIVEGAGGVLVPLTERHTMADLIQELDHPCILVANDALGVLSYTMTAVEVLHRRGLEIRAIVLNAVEPAEDDISPESNREVLAQWYPDIQVHALPTAREPADLIPAVRTIAQALGLIR